MHDSSRCLLPSVFICFPRAMGSRTTNNSRQTAPSLPPASVGKDVIPPARRDNVANADQFVDRASETASAAITPELAALIAKTVQDTLAAERARAPSASLETIPAAASSSHGSSTVPVSAVTSSGGVSPSLVSSASEFLAAGSGISGQSGQGRPNQSLFVPSFVPTFSNAAISPSVFSSAIGLFATNVAFALNGATRDVADRSHAQSSPLLDQPFVVGPGFSPVPAKLVSQIVSGKYVDLSELLAANLELNEPEPQLLLDGRLVITSHPKKQKRRIEDIAAWMEAFSIFSLILVSHFPHRWKDLTQYQLLILRTFRHFAGKVWLAYDKAFREHAAATRLSDWSCMNVQLFNFHAAGSPVRSSTVPSSSKFVEPSGSSSSLITCISWNKGRCTAPHASCRYAHRCSLYSGSHWASTCSSSASKPKYEESKCRRSSPGASDASARSKVRRV